MVEALASSSFEEDQHVVLRAMSWQDFEALLAIRGDRAGVRMYYLDGEIELVSPTKILASVCDRALRSTEACRACVVA